MLTKKECIPLPAFKPKEKSCYNTFASYWLVYLDELVSQSPYQTTFFHLLFSHLFASR